MKRILFALFLCIASVGHAAEKAIDFSAVILNSYGDAYKDENQRPLTLGYFSIAALSAALETDKGETSAKKLERFALSLKISDSEKSGKPTVLLAADIATLQDRFAKAVGNAVLVGRAWHMIEPPVESK